jgi:hypothetical protein
MITLPYQISLISGSKDIHRSFIPKASNAFRSFVPYSKQLAMVSIVTLLLCRFRLTVNCMPWLP